ncbi:Potassium transporter 5 [Capsicum baccatum]|uniref:Potassium transporter 5 n=1 Tax=Capsicum baccatum TaxID=33114 RepID=A0A2G2W045_CAPBA|nr:Potassium transporter 5 [Capsicum baccatum]
MRNFTLSHGFWSSIFDSSNSRQNWSHQLGKNLISITISDEIKEGKISDVPEIQGVRTPSPITMEVPTIVAISRKNFANSLFSSADLRHDALRVRLSGTSSLKFDTSVSSAVVLGSNPTLEYRHINEYKAKVLGTSVMLKLAFQSLGVVYGDIGTSPLYVFSSIFGGGIKHEEDVLAALSLIFYTITVIPVIKYALIVLAANDNGDGGTFALYSLICRYSKVGLLPSTTAEDTEVSNFKLDVPDRRTRRASCLKSALENSEFAKFFLLIATMVGTSMVIVLSAVGGIKYAAPEAMTQGRVVWLSVAILIFLFMFQRFGTEKVGYTFAPILCLWFVMIAGIGIYNFSIYDATIIRALNPVYIVRYFQRDAKAAWISLGGVVMCITGNSFLPTTSKFTN